MTPIEKFKRSEWDFVMEEPCCFSCGVYLKDHRGQAAHILADTKANRAQFGRWILESRYNKRASCPDCNASAMLLARGEEGKSSFAKEVAQKIIYQVVCERTSMPVDDLEKIYDISKA